MYNMSCVRDMANIKNDKHFVPGCGSAWLERLIWDQEVAGSNPFGHIYLFHSVALLLFHMDVSLIWWVWRSWLARQIVALEAEGSSPSIHPFLYRILSDAFGLSPSGKAQDFDSCIRWFESS